MRKLLLALVIGGAGTEAAFADEWVIEAHYPDAAALSRAAVHFQHVIVDRERNVFRVDTSDAGIATLEAEGLTVTIDTAATAKLRDFNSKLGNAAAQGLGLDSIPGFECFRTVEETYQTMDDLVAAHQPPNTRIVTIDDIGPSWKKTQNPDDGYEMRALRITNLDTVDSDPGRPRMAVFSSIHAREYAPAEIDTRFAEWLVNNYGTDPEATWLVDHNDFRLILMANPDARKDAEQQIYQRKNLDIINGPCDFQDDFSQPGVDLNRNFPFHWNILLGGGSEDDTCGQTFHGPYADGSNHNDHIQGTPEPETLNMFQYVVGTCDSAGNCSGGLFADMRSGPVDPPNPTDDGGDAAPADTPGFFVDIHSYASLVLWPWGDTSADSPNSVALRTLGRRIAFFNDYIPQQSNELYFTDGTTVDNMYGLLGVASYTIETNVAFFEDCPTFESNTAPTNINALRYIGRNLHAPYLLPSGPDTVSVTAGPDLIAAGDPIVVSAHLDSSRFNQSNGSEPIHDIASANAFVDQLPWDAGANPTALQAADGSFDSSIEDVQGLVASDGLSAGRHFVYVQGTSDAAQGGSPNAAFVDVAAADQIGTLQGHVTAEGSGDPVVATITVTNPTTGETRIATSDSSDGHYIRTMFAGTVDVHVSAAGYLVADVNDIDLAGGSTVTRDFQLLANCTIFFDDVENGNQGWTAQAPWVMASNVPGNATEVWNTPNYGDGISRSLTSSTYDLTGYSDIAIDFDDRCDTESGFDFGYAEFSADSGANWNTVYTCSGQTSWQSHHIDLPAAANGASALKLRFRLQSDGGQNAPGWAVDNIRIEAGGTACHQPDDTIFADGFDS